MVQIKILGSASGVPTKNRFCESVVVSVNEGLYLLDAGEPCSSLLVRAGIPHNQIKTVFISHMDPDHSSGIFMLIQMMELTGRKLPLKLFLPEEAVEGLSNYLKTLYLFDDMLHFKPEELLLYLSGKSIDKIILTHIHPDLDTRRDELAELGNKYLGKNKLTIAYDGLEMEI